METPPVSTITTTIKDCGDIGHVRVTPERRRRVKTCGQYFNSRPLSRQWLGSVAKDTCKLTPPSRPLWTLMNINSAPPSLPLPTPETASLPLPSGTTTYASERGPDRNKLDLSFHTFPFYSRDSSRAIAGPDPQFPAALSSFVENTMFLHASPRIVVIRNILVVFLSVQGREKYFLREGADSRCEAKTFRDLEISAKRKRERGKIPTIIAICISNYDIAPSFKSA